MKQQVPQHLTTSKSHPQASLHTRMHTGFTLIELMIVVAIVGIAAGVGLPNLSKSVYRSRCRAEALRVAHTISIARNTARAHHHCVDLSVSGLSIAITEWDNNSGACSGLSQVTNYNFAGQYVETLPSSTLTFNARGGTTLTGPWSFVVTSRAQHKISVQVYPAIGNVRIRS